MADDGVTVVLVEQSVNVALTVAERAYFMERGTIMFDGPTKELLERPDLLRSVFLSAAAPGAHDGDEPGTDAMRRVRSPTAAEPILSVRDLSVSFGGIRAVDGTSFDIWPGEIVGVIGPNGAGKTTVFDLVSGFTPVDRGTITLNGRNITNDRAHRPRRARARDARSRTPACSRNSPSRRRWRSPRNGSSAAAASSWLRSICRWPSTPSNTSHCAPTS